jgi:hypothetical protein
VIKETDMVSFEFSGNISAYGIVISISGEKAKVKFVNPTTKEYEIVSKSINKLTKIGTV